MKKKESINIDVKELVGKIIVAIMSIVFVGMVFTKGAYFKNDGIGFNFILIVLGLVYISFTLYRNLKENRGNFKASLLDMAVIIYSLSYTLPVIFGRAISIGDASYTAIKYIGFACTYFSFKEVIKVCKITSNKIMIIFLNIVTITSVLFCIFGIDELSMKLLEPMLKTIGLSYSTMDFRLSSLFQYANVAAIFIAITIFVTEYLALISKKNITKILYGICAYIQLMGLFMTQSRTSIAVFIVISILFILLIKDKFIKNSLLTINIFTIFYEAIFYMVIYQFIKAETRWQIILLVVVSCLIYNFILYFLLKIGKEFKELIQNKKYFIGVISATAIVMIAGIVLVLSLKTNLLVTKNETRKIRIPANVEEKFSISMRDIDAEDDFAFKLSVLDKNHYGIYDKEYGKKDVINNVINGEIPAIENAKYLNIAIYNSKGPFIIDQIRVGNKKITLDYLLVPYELVSKIKDVFIGSSSFNERIRYYTDATEMFKNNMLIGTGGETFRNSYQSFQTRNYISSEAHSYPVDIMLNTGVIGIVSYGFIICYGAYLLIINIKKTSDSKNIKNVFILAVLLLIAIHSSVDLDFSYNIILFIFAILLSLVPEEKKHIDVKKRYAYTAAFVVMFIATFNATSMFIANNIYSDLLTDKKTSAKLRVEKCNTARVLDPNDLTIAIQMLNEYENYKTELKNEIQQKNVSPYKNMDEINSVVVGIRKTADDIFLKNKYSKKALEEVSKVYVRNFINFATYDNNTEYLKYLDKAFACIDEIVVKGRINSNNYHLAAALLDNIYIQTEYLYEKGMGEDMQKAMDKSKAKILDLPRKAEEYFNKCDLTYDKSFEEKYANILAKYK